MPRPMVDMKRRTVTLETQRRSLDMPLDGAGHVRRAQRFDATPVITRADDSGPIGFKGKFMPFGQRNWIGSKRWGFWEIFEADSVTKTIRDKRGENNDITFNRDHDNRLLLARTSNGTLRLSTDSAYGLAEADMGDYSYTHDIVSALERRDLTGMSFAFDMIDWAWELADDGNDLLVHREVELFDVAVVGMPANVDTEASLRMDLLQVARSAGFDAMSFDLLAVRLAHPDDDVIAALRSLASTRAETPPEREEEPPEQRAEPDPGDAARDLAFADHALSLAEELIGS